MKLNKFTAKTEKNIQVAKLFVISLIFVGVAAFVAMIGLNYIENRDFKETFYCVGSLKVNNKIRVVQISDLHNCVYGNKNEKLIERVEKLKPDIIIYTGDCIDAYADSNDRVVQLCAALAKVAPSYYIFGNNEVQTYYDTPLTQVALDRKYGFTDDNRNPQLLMEREDVLTNDLEQVGVKVLKNALDTVVVGNTNVEVYGVLTSNPSAFWSYGGESFDAYIYNNENNLKITAIHEPAVFEAYAPYSWGDLLLAGHTHGGIAKIPMVGPLYTHDGGLFPARSGHYVYGRSDVQGRPLIISSGLENKNLFRINNQPELVIVDINKF